MPVSHEKGRRVLRGELHMNRLQKGATRAFNGKEYYLSGWEPNKQEAKETANYLRKDGILARITEGTAKGMSATSHKGYYVWERLTDAKRREMYGVIGKKAPPRR
jgi:hypothetical protein